MISQPEITVASAAQRNHHERSTSRPGRRHVARRGPRRRRPRTRHLDDVEVVQRADPGEAGEDVEPAEDSRRRAPSCRAAPIASSLPHTPREADLSAREGSTARRLTRRPVAPSSGRRSPLARRPTWRTSSSTPCYKLGRFYPPDRDGAREHLDVVLPGRQDRRDRRQRRRQVAACCGSWPASTTATPARPASRPASPSATSQQEPQLDADARTCSATSMDGVGADRATCSTATTR